MRPKLINIKSLFKIKPDPLFCHAIPVYLGNVNILILERLTYTGFGDEYFKVSEEETQTNDSEPFLQAYKSVLTSKSSEETMVGDLINY